MTIPTSQIINQLIEDNKKLKKCIQCDDATNRQKQDGYRIGYTSSVGKKIETRVVKEFDGQ